MRKISYFTILTRNYYFENRLQAYRKYENKFHLQRQAFKAMNFIMNIL